MLLLYELRQTRCIFIADKQIEVATDNQMTIFFGNKDL